MVSGMRMLNEHCAAVTPCALCTAQATGRWGGEGERGGGMIHCTALRCSIPLLCRLKHLVQCEAQGKAGPAQPQP